MNRSMIKHLGVLLVMFMPLILEGCGGGGGGGNATSIIVSQVVVTPSLMALPKGSVQQFSAKDISGNPVSVTWSLSYPVASSTGTIDSSGLYHAPATLPDDNLVTVQATDTADPNKWGSVSFFLSTGANVTFPATATDVTSVVNFRGLPIGLKMASSKGKIHLTWVTTDLVNGTRLWYSGGDKNGNFTTPHDILADLVSQYPAGTPNPGNPVITTDGANIFIAWDDNNRSNYQVYLVRGVISSSITFAPFALNNGNPYILVEPASTVQQQLPSIASSPGGKVELAWEVANGSYVIHYVELDKNGMNLRSQDVPSTASLNYQIMSSVASDLNGNISIVWVDEHAEASPNILYSNWSAGQSGFSFAQQVETAFFTLSDLYSMAMDTSGAPYLAWSITAGQPSTTNIYSAGNTGNSFTVPVFRESGFTPTLKIDLLNYANLSWYDLRAQSVNFIKSGLGFAETSSYQTSGANPVMDIDEGGRVNLMFTTSGGQNFSTWFTRGE